MGYEEKFQRKLRDEKKKLERIEKGTADPELLNSESKEAVKSDIADLEETIEEKPWEDDEDEGLFSGGIF